MLEYIFAIFATITMGMFVVDGASTIYSFSFFPIIIFLFHINLWNRFAEEFNKKTLLRYFPISLVMSIALIFGKKLYFNGFIDFFDVKVYICISFVASLLAFYLFCINAYLDKRKQIKFPSFIQKCADFVVNRPYIVFLLFLVSWIPCLLAFYPGLVDVDTTFELYMVQNNDYSAHHPILHVLLYSHLVELGNNLFGDYNMGIVLYLLVQMIIVSTLLTRLICKLNKRNVGYLGLFISLIYLYLNPLLHLNVITTTKDALYTVFMLNFVYELYEAQAEKKIKNMIILLIFGFFMLQFRNNALYALILFVLFIAVTYRFKAKLIVSSLVILVLINSIFTGVMKDVYSIKDGSVREMLSVPIQQLARTYSINPDSFNSKEKEIVYSLFDNKAIENYNPLWSDLVKNSFNDYYFDEHKEEVIELYISKGIENPTVYLNAFLHNTLYIWYPFAINDPMSGDMGTDLINKEGTVVCIVASSPPARLDIKSRMFNEIYTDIANGTFLYDLPILSLFFSIGLLVWSTLLAFLKLLYIKERNMILPYGFLLCYIITLFLGPVVFTRYFLFLWMILPINLMILMLRKEQPKNIISKAMDDKTL